MLVLGIISYNPRLAGSITVIVAQRGRGGRTANPHPTLDRETRGICLHCWGDTRCSGQKTGEVEEEGAAVMGAARCLVLPVVTSPAPPARFPGPASTTDAHICTSTTEREIFWN